jgi:hypothetical protein
LPDTDHHVRLSASLGGVRPRMLHVRDMSGPGEDVVLVELSNSLAGIWLTIFGTLEDHIATAEELVAQLHQIRADRAEAREPTEQGTGPDSFDCPEAAPPYVETIVDGAERVVRTIEGAPGRYITASDGATYGPFTVPGVCTCHTGTGLDCPVHDPRYGEQTETGPVEARRFGPAYPDHEPQDPGL